VLLFVVLVFGLFVGWIAGALLGERRKPAARDLYVGLAGSYVGGLLVSVLAGDGLAVRPSGIIGSVVGAVAVLVLVHLLGDEPPRGTGTSRSRRGRRSRVG
jgi:uncharacterized membrane protein YeaQ/YmgE (transglycosylase-associated protein family)